MAAKKKHPVESQSFLMVFNEGIVRLLTTPGGLPTKFLLFDFLGRHRSSMVIYCDKELYRAFNTYLENRASILSGGEVCQVSMPHFRRSFYQLRDAGILLNSTQRAYYLNPHCAYRGPYKALHAMSDDLYRRGLLPESPISEPLALDEDLEGDDQAPESEAQQT